MSVERSTSFVRRTREVREAEERDRLAPAATRSTESRGRARDEPPDAYRTAFERDRDRITHSKAFRRLKHKTQVFINPEGDHFVTRLTHTIAVTQIARALAAALSLNEPLAEAIALGHDVGHSPFGHTGEEALSPYFAGEWHHAAQSVRVFEVLEDLNLTWEVRDGIRAHSWKIEPPPATPEAFCVRYADRIAYLSHDALDAFRAGVLSFEQLPPSGRARVGGPRRGWLGAQIKAVIDASVAAGGVGKSVAELIDSGDSEWDLREASIDRFHPHQTTGWFIEKVEAAEVSVDESYGTWQTNPPQVVPPTE